MLQHINMQLYYIVNSAPYTLNLLSYLATFCSEYLVFIPVIMLGMNWFLKLALRPVFTKTLLAVALSLSITTIIRHISYFPLPFIPRIDANYVYHVATNFSPNQHAVVIWTICLAFYFNYVPKINKMLGFVTVVALLNSCSQLYLGNDWQLDIVGAFIIALDSAYIVSRIGSILQKVSNTFFKRSTTFTP